MLIWGLRGTRIDDHPICRKCGFDLVGLPGTSLVCSECGADVKRKGAVRTGHRRRRRGLVVVGASAIVLCGVFLGLVGWVVSKGIDINQYKPVWWLVRKAKGNDAKVRDAALGEMLRRIRVGQMREGHLQVVVDEAIAAQGDLKREWATGWGDIVELLNGQGKMGAEKWRKYLRQGPVVVLEARAKVRLGAVVPVRMGHWARMGSKSVGFIRTRAEGLFIDGQEVNLGQARGLTMSALFKDPYWQNWVVTVKDGATVKLTVGTHTVKWPVEMGVFDRAPKDFVDEAGLIGREKREFQASFEIVEGPTVKLSSKEELAGAMGGAFGVSVVDMRSWYLQATKPPADVAFDVFMREGQHEAKVGRIVCAMGNRQPTSLSVGEEWLGRRCEVVLRPSVEAAEGTVEMTQIWGKEVVIKEVGVTPGAARPMNH